MQIFDIDFDVFFYRKVPEGVSRKRFKEEHTVKTCVDNQFPSSILSFLRHMIYDSHQKRFSYQLGNTKEYHRCYTGGAEPVLTYYCILYHSGGESLDHFMTVPLFFCLIVIRTRTRHTYTNFIQTRQKMCAIFTIIATIHSFYGVIIIVQVE